MRCSSCELLLDEYVDGELSSMRAAEVAAHLQTCDGCRELHERLRNVDALLATVRPVPLPAAFTHDVMAAVRELPAPVAQRRTVLQFAAFYLVTAWVAAAAAFFFFRPGMPGTALPFVRTLEAAFGAAVQGLHAVAPVAPLAASVVVTILSVDVLLLAIVVLFYRNVRPRLAARLAVAPEVTQ